MKKKQQKTKKFVWNVWIWDINHRKLETYDVVPMFIREIESLKKNGRPASKEDLSEFLQHEAMYHFWSKCEYEVLVGCLHSGDEVEKVDVYQQLMLNWEHFIDAFWDNYYRPKYIND